MNRELILLRGYSKICCEDCEGTEELTEHRANGRVKCAFCLNDQLRALEEIEEKEREGYYTDYTYEQLAQERNA